MKYNPQRTMMRAAFVMALAAVAFAFSNAQAQSGGYRGSYDSDTKGIELSGFYGWQFGGDFTVYQGEVDIRDNENFGGSIGFPLPFRPGAMLELGYTRQNTRVDLKRFPSGARETLFDMAVEYYQIGAMYNRRAGNVSPFGGLTMGATRFAPKQGSYNNFKLNDEWRFSMILGLGMKSYFNERLGLRLQARLLMPMNFHGTSFWFGTGGSGLGVGGGSSMVQGDVSAGLFLLF